MKIFIFKIKKQRFKKLSQLADKLENQNNYMIAIDFINKAIEICPPKSKVSILNRKGN